MPSFLGAQGPSSPVLPAPPPSSLFIPHDLSWEQGTRKLCSFTSSPSFLLFQVLPASQGVGEGTIYPSLDHSLSSH